MYDPVINIDCRHLWDVVLLISVTYVKFSTKMWLMTLKIAHKNEPCLPTTGRKTWLLLSVRDMSWYLRNPCFTKFSLVRRLEMTCNQLFLMTLKKATQNTRLIGYFQIVLMKLFELYMCELDININYRHLWDVFLLVRVTFVTFFYRNCI